MRAAACVGGVCTLCVVCAAHAASAAHAACGRARAVRARAPPCALPPFTVTAPCLQAPRRPRASCWVGQGEGDAHRLVLWRVRCACACGVWSGHVRCVRCCACGGARAVGSRVGRVWCWCWCCACSLACVVCACRAGRSGRVGRGAALSSSSSSPPPSAARAVAFWADRLRSCLPRWTRRAHGGEFYCWNSSSEERGDWRSPLTVRPCPLPDSVTMSGHGVWEAVPSAELVGPWHP